MNTLDRFKDFFGMNPETLPAAGDEYYEDEYEAGEYRYGSDHRHSHSGDRLMESRGGHTSSHYGSERRASGYGHDEFEDRPRRYRTAAERESDFMASGTSRSMAPVRGSVALQPEIDDFDDYDDGLVVRPQTVLERPRAYADAKSAAENYRDGRAVVLDLSLMQPSDAQRMLDFASGLAFALDGKIAKLADRERTFFLEPAGMDLTDAEKREAAARAFRR